MTVTTTITDLTARQTKRLGEFLVAENADRVSRGLPAYPTLDDWAIGTITEKLTDHVRSYDIIEGELIKEAYLSANNATQNTVKTTLGL